MNQAKPVTLKNIKIIIWDVDGTLYQSTLELSNRLHRFWVGEVMRKLGVSFERAEKIYYQYKKKYLSSTLSLEALGVGSKKEIMVRCEKMVRGEDFLKKDPKLLEVFKKLKNFRHLALRNGMMRGTIARLKALGLIDSKGGGLEDKKIGGLEDKNAPSSKKVTKIRCSAKILPRGGMRRGVFERVFSTIDDFETVKPDLVVFKKVLAYTKLPANQHLMIGDRVKVDLIPAKKLGMRTCLVWQRSNHPSVDISIPRIYDIVKILK